MVIYCTRAKSIKEGTHLNSWCRYWVMTPSFVRIAGTFQTVTPAVEVIQYTVPHSRNVHKYCTMVNIYLPFLSSSYLPIGSLQQQGYITTLQHGPGLLNPNRLISEVPLLEVCDSIKSYLVCLPTKIPRTAGSD
jgi:hypothetical protein